MTAPELIPLHKTPAATPEVTATDLLTYARDLRHAKDEETARAVEYVSRYTPADYDGLVVRPRCACCKANGGDSRLVDGVCRFCVREGCECLAPRRRSGRITLGLVISVAIVAAWLFVFGFLVARALATEPDCIVDDLYNPRPCVINGGN